MLVNEWQAFDATQSDVSEESAAITSAFANASVLPEPTRREIQARLVEYDRSVLCDEIPFLASHTAPEPRTTVALQRLFDTVARAAPSAGDSAFYAATVSELSLSLIAVASVLDTQHRRWHLALTTALTLLVALNFALILSLDRPFDGAASVSTTPNREGLPSAQLDCRSAT